MYYCMYNINVQLLKILLSVYNFYDCGVYVNHFMIVFCIYHCDCEYTIETNNFNHPLSIRIRYSLSLLIWKD